MTKAHNFFTSSFKNVYYLYDYPSLETLGKNKNKTELKTMFKWTITSKTGEKYEVS